MMGFSTAVMPGKASVCCDRANALSACPAFKASWAACKDLATSGLTVTWGCACACALNAKPMQSKAEKSDGNKLEIFITDSLDMPGQM